MKKFNMVAACLKAAKEWKEGKTPEGIIKPEHPLTLSEGYRLMKYNWLTKNNK